MPNPLPTPGSVWLRGSTTWWVTAITQRGVLLHSELGQALTVPPYAWPGDFTPRDSETRQRRVLRGLLIGGASGVPFERLWDRAAQLDVDIDYHIPWSKDSGSKSAGSFPKRPLPSDIDLVILVPLMGHAQYNWYLKLVKGEGVPMLVVQSQGFLSGLQKGLRALATQGKIPGLLEEDYGAVPRSRRTGWWELSVAGQWTWKEASRRAEPAVARGGLLAAVLAGLSALLVWST
jgi:hypothetical protein